MKNILHKSLVASGFILLAMLTGCANNAPYNYDALRDASPRSIVVIPPENNTVEVDSPYIFLSTISRPLAEKGYYVFPVAVIDTFLKENGLPTPAEMNQVPLDKIRENIGADAVLYVTINDWGQKYQVLSSTTVVSAYMKLIDTRTGEMLWDATAAASQKPNSNGGLIGALATAIAQQITASVSDQTPAVARIANDHAINSPNRGLLNGPYAIKPEQK